MSLFFLCTVINRLLFKMSCIFLPRLYMCVIILYIVCMYTPSFCPLFDFEMCFLFSPEADPWANVEQVFLERYPNRSNFFTCGRSAFRAIYAYLWKWFGRQKHIAWKSLFQDLTRNIVYNSITQHGKMPSECAWMSP